MLVNERTFCGYHAGNSLMVEGNIHVRRRWILRGIAAIRRILTLIGKNNNNANVIRGADINQAE